MFGRKKRPKSLEKEIKEEIKNNRLSLVDQCKLISSRCVGVRRSEMKNYDDVALITKQEFEKYGIRVNSVKKVNSEGTYIFKCEKGKEAINILVHNEGDPRLPEEIEEDNGSVNWIAIGLAAIIGGAVLFNTYGDRLNFLKDIKLPGRQEQGQTETPTVSDNIKVREKTKDVAKPNVEEPQNSQDELSMCLIDPKSGSILFERDCDHKMNMASTTKIMTAIIGLENCDDLNKTITVTQEEIQGVSYSEYSNMGLQVGEEISYDKIFEGFAVHSACEAGNVIAKETEKYVEQKTGKKVSFIDLMNKKAKELGMENTHFTNTYGASEKEHHTSTKDMCKLMLYCMNQSSAKESFRTYFGKTTNFVKPKTNKSQKTTYPSYTNNNLMINEGYKLFGKTGYTDQAGQCWVFCAEDAQGNQIMGAVFSAANKSSVANDVQELIRYGFKCLQKLTKAKNEEKFVKLEVSSKDLPELTAIYYKPKDPEDRG